MHMYSNDEPRILLFLRKVIDLPLLSALLIKLRVAQRALVQPIA